MKRASIVVALFFCIAPPLRADFDGLVRAVSARGLRRIAMPGFGLIRMAVRMVHPAGVHDVELATFKSSARFEAKEVAEMLRANVDRGFRPVVQTFSSRRAELVQLWARPAERECVELFLVTHEPGQDTVVMHAIVDVATFARHVNDPGELRGIVSR